MPDPFKYSGAVVDLSPRVFQTATVVGSPAAAAETIIASVTLGEDIAFAEGVWLNGYCAFTMGTNGVSSVLRIRRTDASGTIVKASGAVTGVAASLYDRSIEAFDTGPTIPGQVYVMTMTNASASAASTVSAVTLLALLI